MGDQAKMKVAIVGASGYGGIQLVRLLQDHPNLELTYIAGDSTVGQAFGSLYPYIALSSAWR